MSTPPTSMATVLELGAMAGSSTHAAFRRFVEVHDFAAAGVVMDISPCDRDPLAYRRKEIICSESWGTQFGGPATWPSVLRSLPYSFVSSAEAARTSGGAVRVNFVLPDLRSEPVSLNADVYCNQYHIFVLIWVPRRELLRRRRIIVPTSAT